MTTAFESERKADRSPGLHTPETRSTKHRDSLRAPDASVVMRPDRNGRLNLQTGNPGNKGGGGHRTKHLDIDDPRERKRLFDRESRARRAEKLNAAAKARRHTDPEFRARVTAQVALNRAVRAGTIQKPTRCPFCGDVPPGHCMRGHIHDPHERPFRVTWRCVRCACSPTRRTA